MPWHQTLFPPFIVAAIFALAAGLLLRPLLKQPPADGWQHVIPGSMHGFSIVAGSGIVGLLSYVRLFIGSARPDGEQQMQILVLLIFAFLACTILATLTTITIGRQAVRWRGQKLEYVDPRGAAVVKDLGTVVFIRRLWTGAALVGFSDGDVLKLDRYAKGVDDLCARIIEVDEQLAGQMPG